MVTITTGSVRSLLSMVKLQILSSSLSRHSPPNLDGLSARLPGSGFRPCPARRSCQSGEGPAMPGPAGQTFPLLNSKRSSGQPCPPASSLRPEADGTQNAASPGAQQPETGMAAPAPKASSLLWQAPAARDRGGWALWGSHVGQPRACQLSGWSHNGSFHRGESWPIKSPQGDVPGPGDKEWEVRNSGRSC